MARLPSPPLKQQAIQCPQCRQIGTATQRGSYNYLAEEIGEPLEVAFLDCDLCRNPLVLERYYNYETQGFSGGRFIFPRRQTPGGKVPRAVREAYAEAIKCRDAEAFTAAILMCRRALEAIAEEKKAQGRSLYHKLENLKNSGFIPEEMFEWFSLLREMGNDAAHSTQVTHTDKDADDTIDFVLAITEYVYTYRLRFAEFKARAAAAKAP
jgi:hypothetical protein